LAQASRSIFFSRSAAAMMMRILFPMLAFGAPTNDVTLYFRALYGDQPDACNDTLAHLFLTGVNRATVDHEVVRKATRATIAKFSDNNVIYFPARSNYIDRVVERAVDASKTAATGPIKQVVSIAAGFDSRAYRLLPDAGLKFFEIDRPAVIAAKKLAVSDNKLDMSRVEYAAADLSNTTVGEALKSTGFDASLPTVYIVEGLIYYLEQQYVDALYKSIGEIAAPGSTLTYDFANECLYQHTCPNLKGWEISIFLKIMELKKEPWKSGMVADKHRDWLKSAGFEMDELISFLDAKEKLNVTTWTKDPVMGQMNVVMAHKSQSTPLLSQLAAQLTV